MSYRILYRSLFIKAEGQYLPMIESGDNNCWEVSPRRRARDWHWDRSVTPNNTPFAAETDIWVRLAEDRASLIKSNDEWCQKYPDWGAYDDQQYGYYASVALEGKHTSQTSYATVQKFYQRAFTKAKTVEELMVAGVWLYIRQRTKHDDSPEVPVAIKSTADLIQVTTDFFAAFGKQGFAYEMIGEEGIARLAIK